MKKAILFLLIWAILFLPVSVLANNIPTISGTPETQVDVNKNYSFTPTAYDSDVGDPLTFFILNVLHL